MLMKTYNNTYKSKITRYKYILRNFYYNPKAINNLGNRGPSVFWPRVPRRSKRAKEGEFELLTYPIKFNHRNINIRPEKNAYLYDEYQTLKRFSLKFLGDNFKSKILSQSEGICYNCNILLLDSTVEFEIHHIQPFSRPGKTNTKNCIPLCSYCHNLVSLTYRNKDNPEFKETIEKLVKKGIISLNED